MDIALKKLALVERLLSIWDEAALLRVAKVIEKETPAIAEDEFTDEETAELEARYQEMASGKVKGHTREESMHLARKGIAK